jgi:cysteine desulfurase
MKLSTKGRYAVMAMVELASRGDAKPTTLAEIAERQDISLSYLEQLFAKLRRAGIVRSVRGPGGGYVLAFPPRDTRISDIIIAVDEPVQVTRCKPGSPKGCTTDGAGPADPPVPGFGLARRRLPASRAWAQRPDPSRCARGQHQRRRGGERGRMKTMAYLDHNATAPVKPDVADTVRTALGTCGNPSSVHGAGRAARRMVEDGRDAVAALVGARPERVVFTAGGTEANNLALRGAARGRVLAGVTEHPSVLKAAESAETIPVHRDGRLDLDALDSMLREKDGPAVVSVMLANNETGIIHPVAGAAVIAKRHGALLHCDAAQAPGRIAVDMASLGVDLLTLSAHKIGGPMGVGALVLGPGVEIESILRGGGQERRRRAGTENVAAIAGFGVAAALAQDDLGNAPRLARLHQVAEARLVAEGAVAFGASASRLPNTSCLSMPGVASDTQVMGFDLAGFAVSSGAACSSGKVEPSHVLAAMGVPEDEARTAIRVSLGWSTTDAEVEAFIGAWLALRRRLGAGASAAAA